MLCLDADLSVLLERIFLLLRFGKVPRARLCSLLHDRCFRGAADGTHIAQWNPNVAIPSPDNVRGHRHYGSRVEDIQTPT
jgi:hypothetical protein